MSIDFIIISIIIFVRNISLFFPLLILLIIVANVLFSYSLLALVYLWVLALSLLVSLLLSFKMLLCFFWVLLLFTLLSFFCDLYIYHHSNKWVSKFSFALTQKIQIGTKIKEVSLQKETNKQCQFNSNISKKKNSMARVTKIGE